MPSADPGDRSPQRSARRSACASAARAFTFAASTAALPPVAAGLERRRAHRRDELLVLRRFDRDDRVAGVDRATELVRRLDRHDVAQLTDAEQGGDARHQVLAEGRRRAEHVRVVGRERGDLRREHGGERLCVRGVLDLQHALDALDRGRLRSRRRRRPPRARRRRSARPRSCSRTSRTWPWRD